MFKDEAARAISTTESPGIHPHQAATTGLTGKTANPRVGRRPTAADRQQAWHPTFNFKPREKQPARTKDFEELLLKIQERTQRMPIPWALKAQDENVPAPSALLAPPASVVVATSATTSSGASHCGKGSTVNGLERSVCCMFSLLRGQFNVAAVGSLEGMIPAH